MKVLMPLKPIKYRFKVFLRCESNRGYFLKLIIYTWKNVENVKNVFLRLLEGWEDADGTVSLPKKYNEYI